MRPATASRSALNFLLLALLTRCAVSTSSVPYLDAILDSVRHIEDIVSTYLEGGRNPVHVAIPNPQEGFGLGSAHYVAMDDGSGEDVNVHKRWWLLPSSAASGRGAPFRRALEGDEEPTHAPHKAKKRPRVHRPVGHLDQNYNANVNVNRIGTLARRSMSANHNRNENLNANFNQNTYGRVDGKLLGDSSEEASV